MMKILHPLMIILVAFVAIGCSSSSMNPASPIGSIESPEGQTADNQRMLWGVWNVWFDEAELTVEVEPVRNPEAHFNVTNMILPPNCDDCVVFEVFDFDPVTRILGLDVILRNPTPIPGRDVRAILYDTSAGHRLTNADGWTKLHDIPAGGTLNGFIAYASGEVNRIFAGGAEHSECVLVYIPVPPQYSAIQFAVDASWPGNCKEPYDISDFLQGSLYDCVGASAQVSMIVHDWQDNVDKVTLVAPEITGESWTQLALGCGTWYVQLYNNEGAPVGDYEVRLIATSEDSGDIAFYDYVTITIEETPECWFKTWGASENYDNAHAVATTENGEVYVTGRFKGTIDFDIGPGIDLHESIGDTDAFLMKLDYNGIFQWARTWGGTSNDGGNDVAYDGFGNAYVTGHYKETVDFDPGPGTDNHTSKGSTDMFLCKYSTDGDLLWARTWGSTMGESASGVAKDLSNNAYVVGYYQDKCDFDPGPGVVQHISAGAYDIFLSKFDPNGNFEWVNAIGGTGWDMGFGIDGDASSNVYITGYFSNNVDFDVGPGTHILVSGGSYDAYLVKYNAGGNIVWGYSWGGSGQEKGYFVDYAMTGQVYTGGQYENTTDFDPGPGTESYPCVGGYDVYVCQYYQNGDYQWAKTWGSAGDDYGYAATSDNYGNVYVAGMYQLTCDFNPGPTEWNATSNGQRDFYVNTLGSSGTHYWLRSWGSTEWDTAQGIDFIPTGYLFLAGSFSGPCDFNPDPAYTYGDTHGQDDAFLLKMTLSGSW